MNIQKKLDMMAARNDFIFEEARNFDPVADQVRLVKEQLEIKWQLRAANAFLLAEKYDRRPWWQLSHKETGILNIDDFCASLFMAFLEFGIERAQQLAPKDKLMRSKLAKTIAAQNRDSLLAHILAWHLAPRPNRYGTMLMKFCHFGKEREAAAFASLRMPEYDNENSERILLDAVSRAERQLSTLAVKLIENSRNENVLAKWEKYPWIVVARLSQQNRSVISSLKKGHYYPSWININDMEDIILHDQELTRQQETEKKTLEHRVRMLRDNLAESLVEAKTWQQLYKIQNGQD